MSWGRRWTHDELMQHIGGKKLAKIAKEEKKISLDQSAIDAGERKKFRDHKPTGKHKFCESFMDEVQNGREMPELQKHKRSPDRS